MGRRKNRRGRIEGNCGLLPILLNFLSVRFRERKQDKRNIFPLQGRFTKLGARFSIVAANLSGIFQVFAGFNAQTQEGKQKKIKET